jgi:uncharacterized protein
MSELLPLQELFTRLREAGLPLGLRDYEAVVVALQGGYGVADRAALERLCRTLWVRSVDEGRVFDYCFSEVMVVGGPLAPKFGGTGELVDSSKSPRIGGFRGRFGQLRPLLKKPWAVPIAFCLLGLIAWGSITLLAKYNDPNSNERSLPAKPKTSDKAPVAPQQQSPIIKAIQSPSESSVWQFFILQLLAAAVTAIGIISLLRHIQRSRSTKPKQRPAHNPIQRNSQVRSLNETRDEIQLAKTVRNSMAGALTDYLPVTQRQMKQSWRYLRQFVRERLPTELDVEATVRHIAHNGMLLNPVLVPPRRNQTELLLLIDQDGSMVAFHSLSARLVETAARGGRLGEAGVYYFHNCPIDYLYHDSKHQQALSLENWLGQVSGSRSVVLIFSDAGAARGGANPVRIEETQRFLTALRQQVRYVAWLNPLPKSRWPGTSAEAIAQFTPMYEISRQGLDGAISALRGRGRLGL